VHQQAAHQQATDDHEAAHRAAFDQAIRPTVTDIDAIALASLLGDEPEPDHARDQAVPGMTDHDE
jgi:hypothetical protein